MILAALLLLLTPRANAAQELVGLPGLRRESERWLRVTEEEDYLKGAQGVFTDQQAALSQGLRGAVRGGVLILGVVLLWGMAETLGDRKGEGIDPVRLAGVTAVTALAVSDVNSLLSLARTAMSSMDSFSLVLLPAVACAGAVNGLPAASAARQEVTLLFLQLLMTLTDRFLYPLLYPFVALSAAGAALGNEGLKRLAALIKWACGGCLTLLLTGFVFLLNLSGAMSGHADALAQKAAKTAIKAAVPVVGGVLSDAADTAVAGAGGVKDLVGVLGLLTVLAICLTPFVRLGCQYLVFKLTAALAATVTTGPAAALLDALSGAFALTMAMVGGQAFLLYVSLITSIQAVSG